MTKGRLLGYCWFCIGFGLALSSLFAFFWVIYHWPDKWYGPPSGICCIITCILGVAGMFIEAHKLS